MNDQPEREHCGPDTYAEFDDAEVPVPRHLDVRTNETTLRKQRSWSTAARSARILELELKRWVNGCVWAWKHLLINERLWMVLSTVVIALASSLYTFYARKQWQTITDQLPELRKSASAAQSAAQIAELSERPWIKIVGLRTRGEDPSLPALTVLAPALPGSEHFITLDLVASVKNIGRSAGIVDVNKQLFLASWGNSTSHSAQIAEERLVESCSRKGKHHHRSRLVRVGRSRGFQKDL